MEWKAVIVFDNKHLIKHDVGIEYDFSNCPIITASIEVLTLSNAAAFSLFFSFPFFPNAFEHLSPYLLCGYDKLVLP